MFPGNSRSDSSATTATSNSPSIDDIEDRFSKAVRDFSEHEVTSEIGNEVIR